MTSNFLLLFLLPSFLVGLMKQATMLQDTLWSGPYAKGPKETSGQQFMRT